MTSGMRNITFDCHDPYAIGLFWQQVLDGYAEDPDDPNNPEDPEFFMRGAGPNVLFIKVPEGKTVKNRVHLDLSPTDRTRDEEVERLIRLGARLVDDRRHTDGSGWAVMTDPEGNEFCVVRSQAEYDRAE
jgi:predicted enzyme related to lactoylglutathione lyase